MKSARNIDSSLLRTVYCTPPHFGEKSCGNKILFIPDCEKNKKPLDFRLSRSPPPAAKMRAASTEQQQKPNLKQQDYAADAKIPKSERNRFVDFCSIPSDQRTFLMTKATRADRLAVSVPAEEVTKEQVTRIQPMPWWKEAITVLCLAFGVPTGVFMVPITTGLVGYACGNVSRAFQILTACMIPLAIMPQRFHFEMLHSWLAHAVVEYFSYKFCSDYPFMNQTEDNEKPRPQILVAPPHGVFPYGNILSILTWPAAAGNHFFALAASAIVNAPVAKQMLRSIGAVDASRQTARRCLEKYPYTIGLSTGGVAEIFETRNDKDVVTECILLKERLGLIKLAIRTGADLVPCYLFGNNQLLTMHVPGPRNLVERWSRKLGVALILVSGRFGLPIPYRKPVFAVSGKRVVTAHLQCEDPTMEQILEVQKELCDNMQAVFDKYKGMYGWENTTLIIK